jgi:hypothetical protein
MTMKQDIEAEFEVQLKKINDPSVREKVLHTWCKASQIGGWKTIEQLRELPFTVITDSKGISLIQHIKAATEGAIALARIQREKHTYFPPCGYECPCGRGSSSRHKQGLGIRAQ